MNTANTAVFLGDFAAERTVLLAQVPQDAAMGAQATTLYFLVGEDVALDQHDYWVIQVGRFVGGKLQLVTREIPLDGALPSAVVRRIPLPEPMLLSRGDLLAARISPRGLPPPIVGGSIAVEFGIQSQRRR